ncbi:prepilin peptidase [bacterium]|nr:prepilin peptidase [bacterium]
MMIIFFVLIFSLCIGSFLNVCIYRIPRQKSIVSPPSLCPGCSKSIKWFDNIPLISYILLRGRCRVCKERISAQYFIVELLTGVLLLLLYFKFGISIKFFVYSLLFAVFIVVSFIDIEWMLIPDFFSLFGIAFALLVSFLYPPLMNSASNLEAFLRSLGGALFGGLSLTCVAFFGWFIFKKEAMGGGDIKLIAMIGAFIGWQYTLMTLFISFLAGAFFGVSFLIIVAIERVGATLKRIKRKSRGLTKRQLYFIIPAKSLIYQLNRRRGTAIPFGPYIVLGAILSILYGDKLLNIYPIILQKIWGM